MAEDFGRTQPVAFLGAAALAGFVASRFVLSGESAQASGEGTPQPRRPRSEGPAIDGRQRWPPSGQGGVLMAPRRKPAATGTDRRARQRHFVAVSQGDRARQDRGFGEAVGQTTNALGAARRRRRARPRCAWRHPRGHRDGACGALRRSRHGRNGGQQPRGRYRRHHRAIVAWVFISRGLNGLKGEQFEAGPDRQFAAA